jgi:signal transduction histidine kinase
LRTPLARIAGLAQSARGHDDDPRDEALERIERLALDAAATTGDLLALVREERVAPRLAEPVDLAALVRDVAGGARRDGIAYELALDENCWIVGDERRVRRLAENLIQNALRHARSRVRLRVGAEGTKIVLAVEDDGAGVPADLRDRLFERFVRGDDDEHGSGLGLAICRSIARAHGGDVVLEERSRFVARLPRLDVKGV